MSNLSLWVIESRHKNPNDFYVKVDDSEFYTAYWIARSPSSHRAEELMQEASEDLVLGEVEAIDVQPYQDNTVVKDAEITDRLRELSAKLVDQEDVQLGAWVSSKGGLW